MGSGSSARVWVQRPTESQSSSFLRPRPEPWGGESDGGALADAPRHQVPWLGPARLFGPGRASVIADDIANLTGVAPRSFSDWCERHADMFR